MIGFSSCELQKITPLGDRRFNIQWEGYPDLEVSFNPLIVSHTLEGDFCLLHWQAAPRALRRWGIYDERSEGYYSFAAHQVTLQVLGQLIEVDERRLSTKPTAVLLFPRSRLDLRGLNGVILRAQ